MIGVEEVGIVLMPPIRILPGAVVVVIAILVEPQRIHHGPFRMMPVEPHDVVLMPPSRASPLVIVVVSAPAGLSGSAVIAGTVVTLSAVAGGRAWFVLRECRCRYSERQNNT